MSRKLGAIGIVLALLALSIILINRVEGGSNLPSIARCNETRVEITFTDDAAVPVPNCSPASALGGVFFAGKFSCKATEISFSVSTEAKADPTLAKGVFLTAEVACGDGATVPFTSSCSGVSFQINLPPGSTPQCHEPAG